MRGFVFCISTVVFNLRKHNDNSRLIATNKVDESRRKELWARKPNKNKLKETKKKSSTEQKGSGQFGVVSL